MKLIRTVWFCVFVWQAFAPLSWAQGSPKKVSFGTGFVVAEGGYIVTAHHILQGRDRILVGPVSGNRWAVAKVVKVNAQDDLALLQAKIAGKPLFIAPWREVPVGLEVFAIGYPQCHEGQTPLNVKPKADDPWTYRPNMTLRKTGYG